MEPLMTCSLFLRCGRQKLKGWCPSLLQHRCIAWSWCTLWKAGDIQLLLKGRENHFIALLESLFCKSGAKIDIRSATQKQHGAVTVWPSCRFIEVIFPFPPLCLEHVCIVAPWVSTSSVWVHTVFGHPNYPGQSWISGTAPVSFRKAEFYQVPRFRKIPR